MNPTDIPIRTVPDDVAGGRALIVQPGSSAECVIGGRTFRVVLARPDVVQIYIDGVPQAGKADPDGP